MQPKPKNEKFWRFVNLNDDETELQIYSDIASYGWYDDDVTPKQFISELKAVQSNNICVRINSNGGDVFAANTIAVALSETEKNGKTVTCKIDGICASAAVRVALACSKISIANGAYMMIHKPMNVLFGYYNADEMRKLAETLDTIQQGIVDAYVSRTGLSEKECSKLMDKETWFTAREAVEKGFADEILFADGENETEEEATIDRIKTAFVASAVASDYSNVPKALKEAFANKSKTKQEGTQTMEIKNYEDLKKAYPDLVADAENKARNESVESAVTKERDRIKALDNLAGKIDPALLNEAKYGEAKMTADDVIVKAFKEDKMLGNGYMNAAKNDASETEKVDGEADDEKTADEKDEEEATNLLLNAAKNCRK
jgi:ATP-dependent protease ClpP protease subunit